MNWRDLFHILTQQETTMSTVQLGGITSVVKGTQLDVRAGPAFTSPCRIPETRSFPLPGIPGMM